MTRRSYNDGVTDLELAVACAAAAAEAITAIGSVTSAQFKGAATRGDVDPVTAADQAAERAILALLKTERPDDNIVAEESGGVFSPGRQWIVDPLDGTVNFLHGAPPVAVSIALYEGHTPLVGVVYEIFQQEMFTATAGGGAYLNGQPIHASGRRFQHSLIATGFPYDRHEHATKYASLMGEVLAKARGIRRAGAAAVDLAYVAAGRYDGFWHVGLGPWDVAAGALLVAEAGGTVTGEDMAPLNIETFDLIVASNSVGHEELQSIVDV